MLLEHGCHVTPSMAVPVLTKGTIASCTEGGTLSLVATSRRKDLEDDTRQGVTLQRAWPVARAINRNLRALTKPEEPGNPTGIWGRSWRLKRSTRTGVRALTATETLLERTQAFHYNLHLKDHPGDHPRTPRPRRPTLTGNRAECPSPHLSFRSLVTKKPSWLPAALGNYSDPATRNCRSRIC